MPIPMIRKPTALLLLVFLWMQSFSLLHLAEFAFDEHEHFGQPCELHHYAQHAGDGAVAPDSGCVTAVAARSGVIAPPAVIVRSTPRFSVQPRAPPHQLSV